LHSRFPFYTPFPGNDNPPFLGFDELYGTPDLTGRGFSVFGVGGRSAVAACREGAAFGELAALRVVFCVEGWGGA